MSTKLALYLELHSRFIHKPIITGEFCLIIRHAVEKFDSEPSKNSQQIINDLEVKNNDIFLCRTNKKVSYFKNMKLLIIDDNGAVRTTLRLLLSNEFEEIAAVGDPKLIPSLLQPRNVDIVLLDMNFDTNRLDCSDGLFWLNRIKSIENPPAVVVITAFGDVDIAVEAMKSGAEDFVTKPWDNDQLIEKLHRAVAVNRQRRSDRIAVSRVKEIEADREKMNHLTLDEMKLRHIRTVIDRCGGNLSAAAEQLDINRQTLYNLLKKTMK